MYHVLDAWSARARRIKVEIGLESSLEGYSNLQSGFAWYSVPGTSWFLATGLQTTFHSSIIFMQLVSIWEYRNHLGFPSSGFNIQYYTGMWLQGCGICNRYSRCEPTWFNRNAFHHRLWSARSSVCVRGPLKLALTLCPVGCYQYRYRGNLSVECIPVIKRDSSEAI
jgi:hypothetical protein